jgi:hypothetical protein
MLVTEPRAFHMLGKHSITKLHSQPFKYISRHPQWLLPTDFLYLFPNLTTTYILGPFKNCFLIKGLAIVA